MPAPQFKSINSFFYFSLCFSVHFLQFSLDFLQFPIWHFSFPLDLLSLLLENRTKGISVELTPVDYILVIVTLGLWLRVLVYESVSHSATSNSEIPWTLACQAPLSMEFSRQEYWSGWPFPYPGDLLTQGLNSGLPRCGQILYHLSYQGSPVPIMVPLIFHLLVDTLNSQSHLPRMPTSLELREVLIFSKWAKEYT